MNGFSGAFCHTHQIGELEALEIRHPRFFARLFLQGAHLTHFAPVGSPNWLWPSEQAQYQRGRAIRGGIPICWPWFGAPGKNPPAVADGIVSTQAHGFARITRWKLESVEESADSVAVSLSLDGSLHGRDFRAGQCHAHAFITFRFDANGCHLALTTFNTGADTLSYSQALHAYLPTPDVRQTTISGLERAIYTDTLQHWRDSTQTGPVRFYGETDRIYHAGGDLRVHSPAGVTQVNGLGSDSTIIWNPGPDKAQRLSDFPADAWRDMLCVETANAHHDAMTLKSGHSHTLSLLMKKH